MSDFKSDTCRPSTSRALALALALTRLVVVVVGSAPFAAFRSALAFFPWVALSAFAFRSCACVHAPAVSPWRRWAGQAFAETLIVTFALWQRLTLACVSVVPVPVSVVARELVLPASPGPTATAKPTTAASTPTVPSASRPFLVRCFTCSPSR